MPQADPFAAYRVPAQPQGGASAGDDPFAAYRVKTAPEAAGTVQGTLMDPARKPAAAEDFIPVKTSNAREVAKGVLKGATSSLAGLGEMMANAGMLPGVQPAAFNSDIRNPVFRRAEETTTAANTPQRVGKVLEAGAEMLLPTGQAAKAVPSVARAGAAFQDVMSAAKHIPVNADAAGEVGLRIMQLAERGGGSLPRPVSQFLQRITHPDKAPMVYEEARDFASGISRLSANEFQRLTPAVAREVAGLRVALNKGVAEAAAKAGKGREYAQAMSEYGRAMKLRGIIDDVVTGAKKALPYAGAAAAGTWLTKEALALLGGD